MNNDAVVYQDNGLIWLNGDSQVWLDENGQLHRADGPALITSEGYKYFCCHGLLHRKDGPAVIADQLEYWFCGIRQDSAAALLAAVALDRAAHEGELV